ncbi:TPA: hypothetical protein NKO81_001321 [Vibrio parahaemolyticus]|nr:hypothetical protein [Vibrio parahaemolyticus]HCG7667761.1 hypothetical protein [Vibrio parahaemolyticus]HCH0785546.1 hypothetical protein [Vibrio parahaemolyticus]
MMLPVKINNFDFENSFETEELFSTFLEGEIDAWGNHVKKTEGHGACRSVLSFLESLRRDLKGNNAHSSRNSDLSSKVSKMLRGGSLYKYGEAGTASWIHSENPLVIQLIELENSIGSFASRVFFEIVVNGKYNEPIRTLEGELGQFLAFEYLIDDERYTKLLAQKSERIEAIQERMRLKEIEAQNSLDELIKSSSEKKEHLEALFKESLRVKGPAKYWKESSIKHKKQATIWCSLTLTFTAMGVVAFFILYKYFLMGQDLGVTLNTVKGIILFFTGITLYGFMIKVVSKLWMSSAHLQRDSEEREQLAHFYLALINEQAIDEESRSIVLQALFSRTDTGLLSGDSSPTMPSIEVMKHIAK